MHQARVHNPQHPNVFILSGIRWYERTRHDKTCVILRFPFFFAQPSMCGYWVQGMTYKKDIMEPYSAINHKTRDVIVGWKNYSTFDPIQILCLTNQDNFHQKLLFVAGKNTIWISEQVEGTFAYFFSSSFSHRNFVSDRCFRNIPSSSFVPGKIKKRRRCSKKEKKRFLSNQPIKKFQIKLKTCGWRCYFWSRLTRLQLFARACVLMLHLPQPLFAITPVSFALIVLRSFGVLGR